MNIKSPEAERLARELARRTGESITGAVTQALKDRLERLKQMRRGRALADELDDLAKRSAALPILDHRSPDEILSYDEHGLPR